MNPTNPSQQTPGVYTTELDAFQPSVVGVATAVPAFVGYTETAELNGKPVSMTPVLITSLADYEQIFGKGFAATYDVVELPEDSEPGDADISILDPTAGVVRKYRVVPTSQPCFLLYNAVRLFYDNGGGTAYIVSVGDYTGDGTLPSGIDPDLTSLQNGVNVLADQVGPTMLLVPDAISLPNDGDENAPWKSTAFATLTRTMLRQCGELGDRFAIFDLYGTQDVNEKNLNDVILSFRESVGDLWLGYGASYFPYLHASVVQPNDVSYMNIGKDSHSTLTDVLTWQNASLNNNNVMPAGEEKGSPKYEEVQGTIGEMWKGDENVGAVNTTLKASLPVLEQIESIIRSRENTLPPSGAIAGTYTTNDETKGVWNAPANVSLTSVMSSTFPVTDAIQGDLNMPVDGKAVNALRDFVGRGTVVWGARTLDGNSLDYRYIQIRRTLIYIEQSIKDALNQYVFAPNDGNTWTTVISVVSNFLQGIWSAGGLMGATPKEAFTVQCGLGSTMTSQDILEGYMIVQVTLQMIRPAEFIELTFQQQMAGSQG